MLRIWQKAGTEIVCVTVVMILFLPLCGFLFQCGCQHLWAGGLKHCNIQNPTPPDCPWCTGPLILQLIPFVLVCLSAYYGIKFVRRFKAKHFLRDVATGLLSAFFTALLLAWIYARILNYPGFFLSL